MRQYTTQWASGIPHAKLSLSAKKVHKREYGASDHQPLEFAKVPVERGICHNILFVSTTFSIFPPYHIFFTSTDERHKNGCKVAIVAILSFKVAKTLRKVATRCTYRNYRNFGLFFCLKYVGFLISGNAQLQHVG